jgi:hypothetical protein
MDEVVLKIAGQTHYLWRAVDLRRRPMALAPQGHCQLLQALQYPQQWALWAPSVIGATNSSRARSSITSVSVSRLRPLGQRGRGPDGGTPSAISLSPCQIVLGGDPGSPCHGGDATIAKRLGLGGGKQTAPPLVKAGTQKGVSVAWE